MGLIIDHIIQGHLATLGGPSIATFALRPGLRLIPCLCMCPGRRQVDRVPVRGGNGLWRSRESLLMREVEVGRSRMVVVGLRVRRDRVHDARVVLDHWGREFLAGAWGPVRWKGVAQSVALALSWGACASAWHRGVDRRESDWGLQVGLLGVSREG